MFCVVGGEHDDRYVGPRADAPTDLDAVDVGQSEIQDHGRWGSPADSVDGLACRCRRDDPVATGIEGGGEYPGDRRFVVDNEDQWAVSHDAPGG